MHFQHCVWHACQTSSEKKKIDWNPQHPIEWAGTTIETHTLSETNESSNEFTIDQEKESILSFETQ